MSETIDVAAELRQLAGALEEFSALRSHAGFSRTAPEVSGWSAEQHLYHLALATDLALDNVCRIVLREGARVVDEGGLNDGALQMFAEGAIPRGAAQAPRMVVPSDVVDADLLTQELARAREATQRTAELVETIEAATGRILHPMLGEMSALEWLRFGNIHAHHHLAIAWDILAG